MTESGEDKLYDDSIFFTDICFIPHEYCTDICKLFAENVHVMVHD